MALDPAIVRLGSKFTDADMIRDDWRTGNGRKGTRYLT